MVFRGTCPPRACPASRAHTRSPESQGSMSKQSLSPLPGHARTSALDPFFRGKTAHLGSPLPLQGPPSNGYLQGKSKGCSGILGAPETGLGLGGGESSCGLVSHSPQIATCQSSTWRHSQLAPHLPGDSDGALIKVKGWNLLCCTHCGLDL